MFKFTSTTIMAVACLAGCAAAAANAKPTENMNIDSASSFNMRYLKDVDQVEFIVTMRATDMWVGLVLGGTPKVMTKEDDMVIFFANGADSTFGDYTSKGFGEPTEDGTKDLLSHPDHNVDIDADTVTIFARRALDTSDSEDFVIPLDQEFNLGYAFKVGSSSLVKHDTAKTIAVTLKSDGTPLFGTMPVVEDTNASDTETAKDTGSETATDTDTDTVPSGTEGDADDDVTEPTDTSDSGAKTSTDVDTDAADSASTLASFGATFASALFVYLQ